MLINEVCKICSLTRKAVEYYVEQGLAMPVVRDNGYRDFSHTEVARLKKISVLRNLGLSVSDIRAVLSGQGAENRARSWGDCDSDISVHSLYMILGQKNIEIHLEHEKQGLLAELARNQDWEDVQDKLHRLQKKQTVLERLRTAFPGYYGDFVCAHFAPYLSDPIQTQDQQEAYDAIVAFLDNVHLVIPEDLREYDDAMHAVFTESDFEKMTACMGSAVNEIESFLDDNREVIAQYMEYVQTEEYQSTPVYRMTEVLKQFNRESGYDDIFIPAMCRLSKSYHAYWETLQHANKKFLERYPDWERQP